MSFTRQNPQPLRTREQIAAEVHQVSLARDLDELATVIALMTISTEVGTGTGNNRQWWCPANRRITASLNYPHDSESDDNRSMGYFQQQPGPAGELWWGTTADMMTLTTAANTFLDRLADDYGRAAGNPVLAGQFAQAVQQSSFPGRYADKWDEAWAVLRNALGDSAEPSPAPKSDQKQGGKMPENIPARPDFNEYPNWTKNYQSRGGAKIDAFFLHTEEGNSNADQLARGILADPAPGGDPKRAVSYHYTASQAADGGVTVVDVVDTDYASWSVGNANNRSINLVFAGSRASWTRQQWLTLAGKAIDVAAYLAVQDCRKYGITPKVIPPPYSDRLPGISDHNYVTKIIGWGSHTDVGPNFPWDVFAAAVAKYAGTTPAQPPAQPQEPAVDALTTKRTPDDLTDRELLTEIWHQLRGITGNGWPQLNGHTPVDALADIALHQGIPGYSPPPKKKATQ